ncbi:hypothetical protein FALBO_13724 [Fusarium albosuccineum]|uniref:Heterokaryon incompatibility domain-containing protein n=1 Tax=Fusarium albosuccineum TaxID=1237068 RepID=A0A8H4L0M7_9HYPO|nr:hypothetical protein FALBO_13724 [Fusarium albosuccineum]
MSLCTMCQQLCPELKWEDEVLARCPYWGKPAVKLLKGGEKKVMHSSWKSFAVSLGQDCPICWTLWRYIRSSPLVTPVEEQHPDFRSLMTEAWYRIEDSCYFIEVRLSDMRSRPSSQCFEIWKTTQKCFLAGLVRNWTDDCLNKHATCRERDILHPTLPTRLLDLGNADSDRWAIVETKGDIHEYGKYVTLSHRWAENTPKLLRRGVYQLQHSCQDTQLPRHYQDIMSICRALPIRYLWIDSLCIFQDSDDDFRSEAGIMADIYQNSFLTLSICWDYSATSLFRSSRRRTLHRVPSAEHLKSRSVDAPNPAPRTGDYAFIQCQRNFEIDVTNALINHRGWVLQERFLSSRIVYLGNEQVYWECDTHVANEAVPQNLKARGKRIDVANDGDERRQVSWSNAVEAYTKCTLTRKEDKLIAISGLVKWLAAKSGETYFSGIWTEYWIPDLLWQPLSTAPKTSDERAPSTDNLRGPSWSWVGSQGPVTMEKKWRGSVFASSNLYSFDSVTTLPLAMLTHWTFNSLERDAFTSLEGATLKLNCPLIPAKFDDEEAMQELSQANHRAFLYCFANDEDRVGHLPSLRLRHGKPGDERQLRRTMLRLYFSRSFDPSLPYFLVPLLLHKPASTSTIFQDAPVHGLIVQETTENQDRQFIRIGSFSQNRPIDFGLAAVIINAVAKRGLGMNVGFKTAEESAFEVGLYEYATTYTSPPRFLSMDPDKEWNWSSTPHFGDAEWTRIHLV